MSHDHARMIAETGGVIGAFGGTPNRDIPGYVDNILFMTEIVGVDHVGLGSDMDGTGGRSVWDGYAQVPAVVAGLLQRGMGADDVAKVLGGNALRVLREVAG
jgi:membrane dipeptidase